MEAIAVLLVVAVVAVEMVRMAHHGTGQRSRNDD